MPLSTARNEPIWHRHQPASPSCSEADMAKKRKTHTAARSTHGSSAPGILPTLPQELLDVIITNLSPIERLAVFRSCKGLRNAVLNCTLVATLHQQPQQQSPHKQQQAEVRQQLRTRLFLAAGKGSATWGWVKEINAPAEPYTYQILQGMSRTEARVPLQLAARSKHDVHLHIRPTEDLQSHSLVPWLSALLHPWLTSPPIIPSLQHVTNILLQDAKLGSPLPDCIRRACPSLKAYTLSGVSWPRQSEKAAAATQPWPQLTELTLHNRGSKMTQLSSFINTSMLPNLARLVYKGYEDMELCPCIISFSMQLTSLEVDMSWTSVEAGKVFSERQTAGRFLILSGIHLPQASFNDQKFIHLLQAAPALQRLSVGKLQLQEDHNVGAYSLQALCITKEMAVGDLCHLAKLPAMPHLHSLEVNVPSSIDLEDIDLEDSSVIGVRLQGTPAWLKHLHVPHTAFTFSFDDDDITEDEEHEVALKLQVLATILSNFRLMINDTHMEEWHMRALGSACFQCICFRDCSWLNGTMPLMWSLMPATIDVAFERVIGVTEIQALCLAATRPVTVRSNWLRTSEIAMVKRVLEAAGNTMVTLLRR